MAQQPAEWRPGFAEDNKAATLADTSAFMVGVLNSPVVQFSSAPNQRIWDAEAPQGCSLHFFQHFNFENGNPPDSFNALVLLSRIDPLSISVKPQTDEFYVSFSGTNQLMVILYRAAVYRDFKGMNLSKGDGATVPCNPHAKNCTEENGATADWGIHFRDQEMAKRFARALMHSALLCGGAKSVSPF
ncbi:MAG: hypothetical protein ABR905_07450 [Terracidiphilus sp.]